MLLTTSHSPVLPAPRVEVSAFAAKFRRLLAIDGELDVVTTSTLLLVVTVHIKLVNVMDAEVMTGWDLESQLASETENPSFFVWSC